MKRNKMRDIFNLADSKYIEEADPSNQPIILKKKPRFSFSSIIACACCALLVLNLAVFLPFLLNKNDPIDAPTEDSYPISNNEDNVLPKDNGKEENKDKVNDEKSTPEPLNVEKPLASLAKFFYNGGMGRGDYDRLEEIFGQDSEFDDFAGSSNDELVENEKEVQDQVQEELEDASEKLDSSDINDNQVSGVSEGDLIKKTKNYIFYLRKTSLCVYSIEGKSSKLVSMLALDKYVAELYAYSVQMEKDLAAETGEKFEDYKLDYVYPTNLAYKLNWEMFISDDERRVTIIAKMGTSNPITAVFSVDIGYTPTIFVKDYKIISGHYLTSRMVDGQLYLFTHYGISGRYDMEKPYTFMPFYTDEGETIVTDNIYVPDDIRNAYYLVVTKINEKNLAVEETLAYLSYSDKVYVSKDNIYLTRRPNAETTEIARIEYSSGRFVNKGIATINGYLKDQYSLDEYNGQLRAVTTTEFKRQEGNIIRNIKSASLYIIDIETMQRLTQVENFAPEGDVVRSVRYDGDYAYVCTSSEKILVDPVFYFDLSDINNITYKQTGEIDGYSDTLINLGNGYVLGIGYGDKVSTLKLELFRETETGVESVYACELENTSFYKSYKTYYIDREKGIIGMPIISQSATSNQKYRYLLIRFNKTYFDTIINDAISTACHGATRGFLQDEYYYVVTDKDIYTFEVGRIEGTLN